MIQKIINNKIFNGSPTETVAGAALVISIAGILSRLLGLLRDRILASQFGAGDTLDVYYAAFRVPDLIYNLMVAGALSAAFIPVFTGLVSKNKKEAAWKLSSGILMLEVILMAMLCGTLAWLAPYVMKLVTPGFSGDKLDQVVIFTRIMFISPIFLGISAVFGGILVSFKKFLIYSIAPIMYNIGIIVGAVFLTPIIGPIGLAWGVVLGAFLHMLIQYPAIKHSEFHYFFNAKKVFYDENIRRVVKLMIPRSLGMTINQINLLVITIFASTLASGSLAVFNFANNIQSVPLGLFGISFAVASFPHLSSSVAKKSMNEFTKIFSRTFRRILFFIIPSSFLIFILRAEITRAILGGGNFTWEDTQLTLNVLGFLSLSLFAQGLIPLLARSFYALQNTKIPFYSAAIAEIVNITLILLLIEKYSVAGMAIAFSVASVVNLLLLFFILKRKMVNLDEKNIAHSVAKIIIASFFAAAIAYSGRYFVSLFVQLETLPEVLLQLLAAGGAGLAGFLLACYWLNIEEFHSFKKSILVRIFSSPSNGSQN